MKTKNVLVLLLVSAALSCTQQSETKVLIVKKVEYKGQADLETVSRLLEEQAQLHQIGTLNWEAFPYQPEVTFRIGHHNNQIWIKYYIKEAHTLATRTQTNSATHRDSCLEFFLDPKGDGNYYNFEVNAIGTVHLAYGPRGGDRNFIEPHIIEDQIRVESSLGTAPFKELKGDQNWEMTMVIPADLLVKDKGILLAGLQARANFFKCGDDSSIPHYLSWNPVGTERPNFHTPQFFGTLIFE